MNKPTHNSTGNGLTCDQIFGQGKGLTFDDLIILPTPNQINPSSIAIRTSLTHDLILNFPLVSSPMDTVTEASTAIQMALNGGLGFLHINLPGSAAIEQVKRVRRFRAGFIFEPLCQKPDDPISRVEEVKREHGFSTILITVDGTPATALLGMVTKGNVALEEDRSRPLGDVMIPIADLCTRFVDEVPTLDEAREVLRSNPGSSKLPILNPNGSINALVTRDDVVKSGQHPHALLDENKQLRVGAAVSTHEQDKERIAGLIEAGVDVLIIDSAQGATTFAVEQIRYAKSIRADLPIIAGNIVTPDQAAMLIDAGADGLRVGMGSGSICTTQDVLGIGRAQLSAVYHVAEYAHRQTPAIPIIADGGIRGPADMIKALVCGANTVMVGRFIAGCDEAPSQQVPGPAGQRYRRYRGMGSPGAIQEGGALRYGQDEHAVVQGTEGLVPAQGPLGQLLQTTAPQLKKGLEDLGCTSIDELHQAVRAGKIRFELRSQAARIEGSPHDLMSDTAL